MSPAARVIVVGARGFIGKKIMTAVTRLATSRAIDQPVELVPASRGGDFALDLSVPETFEKLRAGDIVVDASSSAAAEPDLLAKACIEKGATLLITSSDRSLVERLMTTFREVSGPGRLVLGAGIFTGASNVLAQAAARALPGATSLELAVSSSPFSGAGEGTVDLMVDSLAMPTRRVEDGQWVDAPSVSAGPLVVFPAAARKTLEVPLAEPAMVAASTNTPNVRMFFAPKPGLLRASFLILPSALLRLGTFRWFMKQYFSLLRRVFLRRVASAVEIVAIARKGPEEASASLSVSDGMEALGVSIAATIEILTQRAPREGTVFIDEFVDAGELRATMARLGPPSLRQDWRLP